MRLWLLGTNQGGLFLPQGSADRLMAVSRPTTKAADFRRPFFVVTFLGPSSDAGNASSGNAAQHLLESCKAPPVAAGERRDRHVRADAGLRLMPTREALQSTIPRALWFEYPVITD
jgi:hypothetical protein